MRTSTSWQPGRSGNPSGRPRLLNSRKVLRAALTAKLPDGGTVLERWADEMLMQATGLEDRLAILKFLDGACPTAGEVTLTLNADDDAAPVARPHIVVEFVSPKPRPDDPSPE